MRAKVLPAVILATALVAAGCGDDDGIDSTAAAGPGLIVCSEVGELGESLDGLLVVTPEGERVHNIAGGPMVPDWVAADSGRAIYNDLDRGPVVVDAGTGTARALGEDLDPALPWFSTRRFVVALQLPIGGSLIDLETGDVVDLGDAFGLDDSRDVFPVPDFDAAEDQVLITNLAEPGVWLVPTAAPLQARLLDPDARSGALSDDGARVAFVSDEVGYVGASDGDSFTPFGLGLFAVEWVDGGILAQGRSGLWHYDAAGGSERQVWDAGSMLPRQRLIVGPSGRWAVTAFVDSETGSEVWLAVDAADRAATALDPGAVDGLLVLGVAEGHALLAGRSEGFQGVGGFDRLLAVDLGAGTVARLPVPEDGLNPAFASHDGMRHLLYGRDGWFLIDLAAAGIDSLPGDPQGVSFSPDGERLVLAAWDGADRATVDLVVAPVDDPALGTSLGVRCRNPVWVAGGG